MKRTRCDDWLVSCLLVAGMLIAAGCSSTMRVSRPDPSTGYYPTETKLKPDEWLVRKSLPVAEYKQLLYIRTSGALNDELRNFVKGSLVNMQYFDEIKDVLEMEQYVFSKGLMGKVPNISDLVGINKLQGELGNFLVADYSILYIGGYDYTFDLAFINPANGEKVLHISHKAFNWSGLDKPLFYPVFNGVRDWLNENSK
jgi:hypothetical protein